MKPVKPFWNDFAAAIVVYVALSVVTLCAITGITAAFDVSYVEHAALKVTYLVLGFFPLGVVFAIIHALNGKK